MLDHHAQALIHAALDGALTDAQALELQQLLERSEEAREYQRGLQQVDDLLSAAPQINLPDDLHEKIVANIRLPEGKPARTTRGWLPPVFRYGFAAAAGLLVAVGIYEFVPQITAPSDYESMAGTMVPARNPGQVRELDKIGVAQGLLKSTARLELRGESLVLDVMLDAAEPVELRVSMAGNGLAFGALTQSQSNFESFEYGDRQIRASGSGAQQFTVLLNRTGDSKQRRDANITLEFLSNGDLVHTGTLQPGESILEQ